MSSTERIVIIGAGGQAKIYTEIIELLGLNLLGYVSCEASGTFINGYEVLCDIESFVNKENHIDADSVIVSIGDNIIRSQIYEKIAPLKINNINLIHPSAVISRNIELGEGNYIGAGSVVDPFTKIGNWVTIGTNASIGHDCLIGNGVNIAPGVNIAGKVHFADRSVASIGSTVIEKVYIGRNSIIGAGALVLEDVPDDSVVFGIPAKVIKKRDMTKTYLR